MHACAHSGLFDGKVGSLSEPSTVKLGLGRRSFDGKVGDHARRKAAAPSTVKLGSIVASADPSTVRLGVLRSTDPSTVKLGVSCEQDGGSTKSEEASRCACYACIG